MGNGILTGGKSADEGSNDKRPSEDLNYEMCFVFGHG